MNRFIASTEPPHASHAKKAEADRARTAISLLIRLLSMPLLTAHLIPLFCPCLLLLENAKGRHNADLSTEEDMSPGENTSRCENRRLAFSRCHHSFIPSLKHTVAHTRTHLIAHVHLLVDLMSAIKHGHAKISLHLVFAPSFFASSQCCPKCRWSTGMVAFLFCCLLQLP